MCKFVQSLNQFIICSLSLLCYTTLSAQCDSAAFHIDAISPLGNDQYELALTFCAPSGFDAVYFYQNTGSFAFFIEGATLLSYPDSLKSTVTGTTYYGYSLFSDTVLYYENHYPNYWGYSDEWWVCNDGTCGNPQSYCKSITLQTQGLPASLSLKGISGGGNPAAGCPMTRYTDCFYRNFEVNITGEAAVMLGTENTCTELSPQISGGSGDYSYLWCTGETAETISPCPEASRTYHLLVTDNQTGCQAEATFDVVVTDIRCGRNQDKVQICLNNQTYCVRPRRADRLIAKKGASLGACSSNLLRLGSPFNSNIRELFETEVYQEGDVLKVSVITDEEAMVELTLYSLDGKRFEAPKPFSLRSHVENELELPIHTLPPGVYLLVVQSGRERVASQKVMITK